MLLRPCLAVIIVFACPWVSIKTVAKQMKCERQSDCVDLGADRCSICVDDKSGKGRHCILIQEDIYVSGPSCVRYPCPYECPNGKCMTTDDVVDNPKSFVPYCKCLYGTLYNGNYCEKMFIQNPLLIAVRKRYDGPVVKAGEVTYLQFQMLGSSGEALREMIVYLKIGDLPARRCNINAIQQVQNVFEADLTPSFVFFYETDNSTYQLNKSPIGYTIDINLLIYSYDQLLYNNSWGKFVSYDDLTCMPMIKVSNCGKSSDNSVRFTRSTKIKMEVDVQYTIGHQCDGAEKISWDVWNIDNGRTPHYPLYVNSEALKRTIYFEPFQLQFGAYIGNLLVTNTKETPVKNSYWCYFRITCQPLVARIFGGSDIMIGPKDGLDLRADQSNDPNSPPDRQSHVKTEWTCTSETGKTEGVCDPKQLPASENYFVEGSLLTPGATYNFTLKVWTDLHERSDECETSEMSPSFAFLNVRVAKEPDEKYRGIAINCLENCGQKVNPFRKLSLRAVGISITKDIEYEWFIIGERKITIESIAEVVPTSSLLVIKENTLNMSTKYSIRVEVQNSSWNANYSFETYSNGDSINCIVDPKSGTKGFTQFTFHCTLHSKQSQSSVVFTFFDKTDEESKLESIFSGRMLGSSFDGVLANVRLTRGHICIYISNQFGIWVKTVIPVTLSDWSIDHVILTALYKNVTDQIHYGTSSTIMAALSFIPEVIPPEMAVNKSDILSTLVGFITAIQLPTFDETKLSVSILSNVLLTMNKPKYLTINPNLMADVFKFIKHQGYVVFQEISRGEDAPMETKEVHLILISILNSIESVLECKDNMYDNIDEDNIHPVTARQLRGGSIYLEESLDLITRSLGFLQVPGHFATTITSKNGYFIIWILLADQINTIPDMLSREKNIPIVFGEKLCEDLEGRVNKDEAISLYVVSSKNNIYWWSKSDVKSRLVSVTMSRQVSKTVILPIHFINTPMQIILKTDVKLNATKIERKMRQLDTTNTKLLELDLSVDVYKIDVPPRSLVTVKFLFPPTNASLWVLLDTKCRPDYAMMTKKAVSIMESSPVYPVQYNRHDESQFLFMGVIPGAEEVVNQSMTYSFQFAISQCQTWAAGVWSSSGCHVKHVDSDQTTRCECTHFSIFSAAFPVPPNNIDPFSDTKLFLTVIDNPLVVGLVVTILLIYLFLCITFWLSEGKNKIKTEVIILQDNFPTDKIPYLITVYTSARYKAGTSSNVGIKLIGKDASSRPHVLQSPNRKVLQTNNDDWFLIYCNIPLGELKSLHIWLDYSGSSPEWLCDRIVVFDLQNKTQSLFVIGEWLALSENEHPEALVLPLAGEEATEVRSIFLDNLVLGFTEKHVILSSLASHPRDNVSRVQRISVIVCGIVVALLCNIIFYLPEDGRNNIDDYNYSIDDRELYVSILTILVSMIVNFTLFMLFKRSYMIVINCNKPNNVHRSNLSNNKSRRSCVKRSQGSLRQQSLLKSMYNTFVRIVKKITETHPMMPVTLPGSQPAIEIRRCWFLLAWTTCITIILLSSYLLMLYGLKLGLIASKKWLSSTLVGFSGDALVFTPLRIIVMSIILALAFQKTYELNTHQVLVDEVVRFNVSNDPGGAIKGAQLRENPMYKPMTEEQRYKIVQIHDNKEKMWNLIDFANSIILLVVVNNIIDQQWTSNFYLNFHNVQLTTKSSNSYFGSVDFFSVGNIPSLERYLELTFVDSLYCLWWYNGKSLNVENKDLGTVYWSRDFTLHMFGLPVVRQFRILPKKCENIVLESQKCIPHWGNGYEDTDDYGEKWKPLLWSDVSITISPWKYTIKDEYFWLPLYKMYSPSGKSYSSGGYVQLLGPTRKQTSLKLANLRDYSWLDIRTSAVFIEMTFYNSNLDLLTHVTLIVEYTITGNVFLLARAATVNNVNALTVWNGMYLAILGYYLLRSFQLINRVGPKVFLSSFSMILQMSVLILMITLIILVSVDDYFSSLYFKEFIKRGLDKYFDFHHYVKYTVPLRYALSLLLGFGVLHMVVLSRRGRTVVNQDHSFRHCFLQILYISLTLVVIFSAMINFTSLTSLHVTTRSIIIMKNPFGHLQTDDFERLCVRIFFTMKFILITICLWLYVIAFTWYTKMAKSPV